MDKYFDLYDQETLVARWRLLIKNQGIDSIGSHWKEINQLEKYIEDTFLSNATTIKANKSLLVELLTTQLQRINKTLINLINEDRSGKDFFHVRTIKDLETKEKDLNYKLFYLTGDLTTVE